MSDEKQEGKEEREDPVIAAFRVILRYPVFHSRDEFEEAMRLVYEEYQRGDRARKNSIIHTFFNFIMRSAEFRAPRDDDYYTQKLRDRTQERARAACLRAVFDLPSSLEGTILLVEKISEWEGRDVAKLLTSALSHMLCRDLTEGTKMLCFALIDALGKMREPYALEALLRLLPYSTGDTAVRLSEAISRWEKKLRSKELRISKRERKRLLAKIAELQRNADLSHYV